MLVEFALISFALYLLTAAMLEMGRAVFASQAIQTAADTLARELATAPLPATSTLEKALETPYVQSRIYSDRALVISLAQHPPGPDLDAYFASLPIVNQMLRPIMISDDFQGDTLLRYPGALVQATDAGGAYLTVRIPRVLARNSAGIETIEWANVVEEVLPAGSPVSHFGIDAPLKAFRGLVSVRMNYPYQASTLTAFKVDDPTTPIEAKDGAVSEAGIGLPQGAPFSLIEESDPQQGGAYAGSYGLGRQYIMLGQSVRPWRKLLTAQAIRRREIYL